jgi:translocator protein
MNLLASSGQLRAGFMRWLLVCVPLIVLLGFLSGRTAQSGPENSWFAELVKPAAYPPPATFGIVWTLLYIMLAWLSRSSWPHGARGGGCWR